MRSYVLADSDLTKRAAKSMERSKTSEWRFPWWMYLAGLSYLVTFGLILYLTFLGPAQLRGFVVAFLPALGAFFIFDLAINRQERLADIFQNRGWLYSVAAALSLLAYWKRREWLESIDRRFFRIRRS
jgi:hypothetical protein